MLPDTEFGSHVPGDSGFAHKTLRTLPKVWELVQLSSVELIYGLSKSIFIANLSIPFH